MSRPDYESRDLEGAAHLAGLAARAERPVRVLFEPAIRCTCDPRGPRGFDPQCGAHDAEEDAA